jgi:hypothetical protein
VLPVGGLKEKILAAKNARMKTVLVPEKNREEIAEMSEEITGGLNIVYLETVRDALRVALAEYPEGRPAAKEEEKKEPVKKNGTAKRRKKEPEAEHFFRPFLSSEDFINGHKRWCLWLLGVSPGVLRSMPKVMERLDAVKKFRLESIKAATREFANYPAQFMEIKQPDSEYLLIPRVSSENRDYIPIGYFEQNNIAADSCMVIGTSEMSLFGILTSAIHMVWVKTVGGRLKTDYRYSAQLCYNTFPFPKISSDKKAEIEEAAEEVLVTREFYPEKTLAELYDPDKMPQDLREAHARLDDIVESCYPGYPFASDEARLECLFKLYEKMTEK